MYHCISANLILSAGWSSRPPSYLGSLSVSTSCKFNIVSSEVSWWSVFYIICLWNINSPWSTLPMSMGPIFNQLGRCQWNCFPFQVLQNLIATRIYQSAFSAKENYSHNYSDWWKSFSISGKRDALIHCDTIWQILESCPIFYPWLNTCPLWYHLTNIY